MTQDKPNDDVHAHGSPNAEPSEQQSTHVEEKKTPARRGFAAMDESRQKSIASAGGRAAHEKGTAHEFSREEARAAGRKGGEAVSENRAHMAAIGRKGGEARQAGLQQKRALALADNSMPQASHTSIKEGAIDKA